MASPFTVYTGTDNTTLTDALLASGSGIVINPSSIVLNASGQDAVNFYDGTLAPLGIGAGLLLTSGHAPGTSNTVGWDGQDNSGISGFYNGDADIDAVVNTVFQTQSYDATTLSFDFSVADPAATSVSFDLVFGSDEFPEWVDQFVDSAIVMVNGVNYALFSHDPNHPLSVVSANLAAGYFQDNAGNVLPIEYDGVSHALKIVAPINPGGVTNHIKIGIADTGDHIYDSGVFLANFSAGSIPGSGVIIVPPTTGTDNSDTLTGTPKDEYFDLKGGDDTVYAGAGDDIVVAGSGNDSVYGGSGADQMKGDAGDDNLDGGDGVDTAVFSGVSANYLVASVGSGFTITDSSPDPAADGNDTLTNVELAKFSDGLFSIDAGGVLTPVSDPGVPPSNTPGSVVISGVGSVGNVLTATVSDPDGVSASVAYQWQVSADGGVNWSNVGANSNTYLVAAADVGMDIQVIASYVDNGAQAESPVSAQKTILEANGDLVVTLMQLTAPLGASNINPLTTLMQDAIDLGVSPNVAALDIKAVLGLPEEIYLQNYDAWAVLQTNPHDATALAVEKVAVQVAILTSLSDDDTGVNLTLKILESAANNQTLDLANANDLADILGVDITGITDKNNYPQPLREIFDRNSSMSDAIADGGDVSVIEAEWQDFLSIQDGVNSTTIGDLSIHVNQAPTGSATANLVNGSEDIAYTITASELLQGFSDSDGGLLQVSGLTADASGTVEDNFDGTWTFTPTANYTGPVELSYTVIDGQGGSAPANQLFVIAPNGNDAPTGAATAILAAGSEDTAYTVNAGDLLAGFSDIDGDTLSVSGLIASDGTVTDNGNGTFTVTPTLNFNGPVSLSYDVIDGNGGSIAAAQNYVLAVVNDAPTGAATAILAAGSEDTAYTVNAGDLLAGFSDIEGDTLSVSGLIASDGTVTDNGNGTFTVTPTLNFNGPVSLSYDVIDGNGGSIAATQNYTVAAVGGVTLIGTAGPNTLNGGAGDDTLYGLAGNDKLDGGPGADHMEGGPGSDSYVVDDLADVVVEAAGGGTDTVRPALASHTLADEVENLIATGAGAFTGTGNALNNVPGLPGTNNDLEHAFGAVRYHERRATGRKGASPGLVVRGEVRLVAALATGIGLIREADLLPGDLTRWRALRRQLEGRQATRRAQRAFRRDPTGYLETLETALLKPVLPP